MKSAETILKNHQLKVTASRLEVLSQFSNQKTAVSLPQLQQALPKGFDRVTLYRTLQAFEKNGLIHKVLDPENQTMYALCAADCDSDTHLDNHPHFKCKVCGNSYCIQETKIPEVKLPQGFFAESKNFLIEGICDKCANL